MSQEEDGKITNREIYSVLTNLTIHAASNNWNRFNNYLIVNSFLILSYVTLFDPSKSSVLAKIILIFISIIGIIGGIFWYFLGERGKKALREFVAMGSQMELKFSSINHKPFQKIEEIREEIFPCLWGTFYKLAGEYYILRWGPLLFAFFYITLLIIAVLR